MVTTRPPKTIVKPTALGSVANTDTKLLIYGLFQKGRVLAQDGIAMPFDSERKSWSLTRVGSRFQACPPFLNNPTSSRFFVSTLMMG